MMSNTPVFEIGLVMAGAISAGAYTAGALDFLIEALDTWETEKGKQRSAEPVDCKIPPHNVQLKVISGASAGSMCAAIATVALGYQFPHIRATHLNAKGNPLFQSWVKDIDIWALLDTDDLAQPNSPLRSILNSKKLPEIVNSVLAIGGPAKMRAWVADPLVIRLSVGNLKGIPYQFGMRGNTGGGHKMILHGDERSFAITGQPNPNMTADWIHLVRPNSATDANWNSLGMTALASGAFPLFLQARQLSRPKHSQLDNREFILPGDGTDDPNTGATKLITVSPTWPSAAPADPYDFLCVDGGIINNEPLELAHELLAGGRLGRNPRAGNKASRALLMIDPFVDDASLGPSQDLNVLSLIGPLTSAWKMQCRFKPIDLALAHDDDVYSRFLLAPDRGDSAPATPHPCTAGGLGGFLGFFHEEFRLHDYLLGRRNCQWFLREHFTLPWTNGLFENWPPALKETWIIEDPTVPHLPIIPLLGPCNEEEPLPAWPTNKLDPESLRPAIKKRAEAVFRSLTSDLGRAARCYLQAGWALGGRKTVVDKTIRAISDALTAQRLS